MRIAPEAACLDFGAQYRSRQPSVESIKRRPPEMPSRGQPRQIALAVSEAPGLKTAPAALKTE